VSSVLVLGVLVGLWGLVLVPAFRQRHDRLDELRSVDRFSSALRVLSRRGSGSGGSGAGSGGSVDRRWVVMPARGSGVRAARPVPAVVTPAVRRRRTLAVLGGLVVVTLALVLLRGTAWIVLQLLADAALAAVLVWCVRSAARERERERERRARTARRARAASRADARAAAEAAPAWSPAVPARGEFPARAVRREVPVRTVPLEGTLPAERAAAAQSRAAAAVASAATGERRVVTPERGVAVLAARSTPTDEPAVEEPFVAEPASGVRLIDLTTPGVWQRQRLFADLPEHLGADGLDDSDAALEALLERRTAAGGW